MTEELKPVCRLIAGPNGAGKTTFALKYLPLAECRSFVNADLIAAGLSPLAPERQIIAASCLCLREIAHYRNARQDFAFETTLSGRSYLRLIRDLRISMTTNMGFISNFYRRLKNDHGSSQRAAIA